ncbi:modifier of mdg4 isoform X2 [Teleopsis dalmanni]|uniref:modifier of mdg4 isoform X2 n=1 Tax=Teleopsis dalmanni TaxID=139649 RepID=UPI0018CCB6DB|nr:modifier of mdg4 isoform X2 [Teleopsis dalmanni]
MAATQQYSLRWNNYFRHLTYALDNHRTNDDFVDVSLCCDGRKIKAHKVVLSSCSSYFKEIFKENPHPHPVIIFKFIKFEDLNSIIEFMYQGEVNVQQEALQSFLQTAELLSVQGLTTEEKEKPKAPPPMEEQKLIKNMPSTTIRPITETGTATQTIDLPATSIIGHQLQTQQQTSPQHHDVQTQVQQIQVQSPQPTVPQAQTTHQLQQQQQQHLQQTHIAQNTITLPANSIKKRKITFSDDDDNIYTTETVDFVKEEPSVVKCRISDSTEMAFIRNNVKLDMPEYIHVNDMDDSQQLSDTQVTTQDTTTVTQNVTQYTSEYEILTESEIEDKFHHADADNTEISIEMGRLLNSTCTTTSTTQQTLEEGTIVTTLKSIGKNNTQPDLPNNKWTECQFCKMVITTVNLWRHIRTQHTPQPPRQCELCNKNFKNKYSLREHIRISHEQKIAVKTEN